MKIFCCDEFWMYHAITLANKAEIAGEVPVGSVVIWNNNLIGEGWNNVIRYSDPCAHAEIISLRQGGKNISNYRLINSTIYVTLEPCIMCIGAMIHARIKRLVFGAQNTKIGGVKFLQQISFNLNINHRIIVTSRILENLCIAQITKFFQKKR
ncbi:MAG: tRNA adenosine(34) deaminase [Candidatus Westeberhardia cardiocondylae]|nr:tRNA adenosine(34) deaminase [Candidatus Westeberhardia cardiocondylae]